VSYSESIKRVMARARDGFKLSELKGADLAAAKRLIDTGKLRAFPINNGKDWLVNHD
jgi:hypothetical protein